MRIILLATLVALATATSVVKNKRPQRQLLNGQYSYNVPISSFGVPQNSVQTLSYSGAGNIDHIAQPAGAGFSDSFSGSLNSLPGANEAVFRQIAFSSTPAPDLASLGFSNAPPFDGSSFQQTSFQFSTPASVGSDVDSPVSFSGFQQAEFANFDASSANVASPGAAGFDASSFSVGSSNAFQAPNPSTPAPQYETSSIHVVSPAAGAVYQQSSGVSSVHADQTNVASEQSSGTSAGVDSTYVNVVTRQEGGSLNEAFGASASADAGVDAVEVGNGPAVEPKVVKNVYFFDSPEDEELVVKPKINYEGQQPTKSYKIIFVKAPSYKTNLPIEIPAPPAHEEKTLVYVLVKKPEAQAIVNVRAGPAPVQTKPEVFFIKYKTQQEAEEAVIKIQSQQGIQSDGHGFGSGSKASAVDVSTVLSGRTLPEGSTLAGAGVISQSEVNALSVGGVAQAAPVSERSGEDEEEHSEEVAIPVEVSQPHHEVVQQVVSVSTEAPSGVFTLSPVTAGPQHFLTGTYNENQIGLVGAPEGLLQGKFGLSVSHVASHGASGVVEVEGTPASVEVSSESAHTEGAAPEVLDVHSADENIVGDYHVDAGAEASAGSNVEVGFQTYGAPAKRSIYHRRY